MIRYLFLVILISYNVNCQINENSYFVNNVNLNSNVALQWNYTADEITFKIVAKTDGWVGFGLSPDGEMENSDIIMTWTNPSNGNVEFRDAHVPNALTVIYDTIQNWQKLFYIKNNGVTTVIFKRKLVVCNANQPASEINLIPSSNSYIIYAWGTNFDGNGLPAYHGNNRDDKKLSLLPNGFIPNQCSGTITTPATIQPTAITDPTFTTSMPITGAIDENTSFKNSTSLGDAILSWNVTLTDVIFKVQTTATGWLGFGISPDGKMASSDMALVWQRNDGSAGFCDAHSFYYLVFPDFVQNWKKLFYSNRNGLQTVIFTRKLVVPKQSYIPNIDINPDGYTNIIYASGSNFLFGFPTYHGPTRGSQSLKLR